ncbi:hypothetical protein CAEBREN_14156 [Caenorhabditis brenneri]|uniref:Uncharacterized protein n=1 Tax=Caenorhabditis brenneri TaxID=135651 RepID=G0MD57_CAEBE|nr:hypothetical protein CAEBREN_14156 [Caenorhabditis brenneri]
MSNNLQNPPLDRDTVTQLERTIRGEFPKFQSAMRFEIKIQRMKQEAQDANVPVELSRADEKRVNTRKLSLHMFSMVAKKSSMEDHPPSGTDSRIHGIGDQNPDIPTNRQTKVHFQPTHNQDHLEKLVIRLSEISSGTTFVTVSQVPVIVKSIKSEMCDKYSGLENTCHWLTNDTISRKKCDRS